MRTVILAVLVTCASFACAFAQDTDPVEDPLAQQADVGAFQTRYWIHVDGQVSIPGSPAGFKEFLKPSLGGGLGAGWSITSFIQVVGHLDYDFYKDDTDKLGEEAGGPVSGGNTSSWFTWVGARGRFNDETSTSRPYVIVGLGIYSVTFGDVTLENGGQIPADVIIGSETALGVTGGFGIETELTTRLHFFGEFRAVVGFADEKVVSYPFRVGLSYHIADGPIFYR